MNGYLRLRVLFLFAGALPLPPRVFFRAVVFFRPAGFFFRAVVFLRAVVFFRPVVFLAPPVPLAAGIGAGGGGVPGRGDGQLDNGSCWDPGHVSLRFPCSIKTSTDLRSETSGIPRSLGRRNRVDERSPCPLRAAALQCPG